MLYKTAVVALLATAVSGDRFKRQANGVNTGVSPLIPGPVHGHARHAYLPPNIGILRSVPWSCTDIQADISKFHISQRCRPRRCSWLTILRDICALLPFAMGKRCWRLGVCVRAGSGFCISANLDGEGQPNDRRRVRCCLYFFQVRLNWFPDMLYTLLRASSMVYTPIMWLHSISYSCPIPKSVTKHSTYFKAIDFANTT